MLTLHLNAAGEFVSQQEIDAVRALLTSKPRPVGWSERRARGEGAVDCDAPMVLRFVVALT